MQFKEFGKKIGDAVYRGLVHMGEVSFYTIPTYYALGYIATGRAIDGDNGAPEPTTPASDPTNKAFDDIIAQFPPLVWHDDGIARFQDPGQPT